MNVIVKSYEPSMAPNLFHIETFEVKKGYISIGENEIEVFGWEDLDEPEKSLFKGLIKPIPEEEYPNQILSVVFDEVTVFDSSKFCDVTKKQLSGYDTLEEIVHYEI